MYLRLQRMMQTDFLIQLLIHFRHSPELWKAVSYSPLEICLLLIDLAGGATNGATGGGDLLSGISQLERDIQAPDA